jgi:hypothetical protein
MNRVFLALLLLGAPAGAQTADPPQRISTLLVYGDEPCPRSSDAEIVVCARQPESERYRIPKSLRKQEYNAARDGSWAGTAKVLEYVSREGRPGSCSPVGSFGQTGCFRQFLEQSRDNH